jgi:iron complex outermembrane recepter protein
MIAMKPIATVILALMSVPALSEPDPQPDAAALETVIVTARLRAEDAQSVPIALSTVTRAELDATLTQNVQQITQMVPSLIYSSPNPRNTALMIRGLGSSVGGIALANDGLEPGVGFYVDQVYHARAATAAFDFMDLERVEALRGPQGTLFGKNTTAGAMSLTTRAPDFEPNLQGEVSGGDHGYRQARIALTGPLIGDVLAGRLSAVTTDRNGILRNTLLDKHQNDANSSAIRGQLLWRPTMDFSVKLSGDYSSIDTECCTQVHVRVGSTLKPAARQYAALAAGKSYTPASFDPYDRLTDIDAGLMVRSHEGGVSALVDWNLSEHMVTSVSAWRWWDWNAANDRDYTGLQIQTLQGIPSRQDQFSQEVRITSPTGQTIEYVAGLYGITQVIEGKPTTGYGAIATYWLLGPEPLYPSKLLDGYRTDGETRFESNSYAAFGEAIWHPTEKLSLTLGLRYTSEDKKGDYAAGVSGGLITNSTFLNNARLSILRPQAYTASVDDDDLSGRVVVSWQWHPELMTWIGGAKGSKSGGINMSGLPLNAANLPALSTAVVKPEHVTTYEVGVKSQLWEQRLQLNATAFHTEVRDYQANVVDTGPGALRGYLANIPLVRVQGLELEGNVALTGQFAARFSAAWNDGKYVSYANGPCPLERIGSTTTVCDLSGKPLAALPRWTGSLGGEFTQPVEWGSLAGDFFLRADFSVRSGSYGDSSDSQYTWLGGYGIVNASLGIRQSGPWEMLVWARNLTDKNYLQTVTVQAGNSGLVVGSPGEPRMFGVTLRAKF